MQKVSLSFLDEESHLMNEAGYSKKAIKLYLNQINVGKILHPNAVSTCLGPCGDLIRLYLKVDDITISEAKFFYLGCPGVASSMSALTTILVGKTLNEANKLTEKDILKKLGNLPQSKHDCLKLSIKSLRKTIQEYEEIKTNLKEINY